MCLTPDVACLIDKDNLLSSYLDSQVWLSAWLTCLDLHRLDPKEGGGLGITCF